MAGRHNRAHKVARKAGPPSEPDVTAVEQSNNSTSRGSDKGGANPNGSESLQRSGERKNSGDAKKSQGSSSSSRRGFRGGRGGRGGNCGNNSWGDRDGRGSNRRNVVQSMQGADLTQRPSSPPKAPKDDLCVVALGGVSEIGRSMTVLEYKNRLIIVDYGVLFPSSNEPGVGLILPGFSYMGDKWGCVEALVIIHGHEDHIGAIPWLPKQCADTPIITSHSTLVLIQAKTQGHRQRPKVVEVNNTSYIQRGLLDLHLLNVNHSISEYLDIVIKTRADMVVHTGDMKMDQTPPDGRPIGLPILNRYGDEGTDFFLYEPTSATTLSFSGSEAGLTPALRRLIMGVKQRAIIAASASNVYRAQAVIDATVKAGHKAIFDDCSMIRNMRTAQELGLPTAPEDIIAEMNGAVHMAPHKVVLVTTSTWGESMAALSRMARHEYRQIAVHDGDLIILSSLLVLGNEEVVFDATNMLAQASATIITGKDTKVHISGHGSTGELLFLYNAACPSSVMPAHGEWRYIRANKELAVSTGMEPEDVVLAQNDVIVDLIDGHARIVGQVPAGNLYVDSVTMDDVDADALANRAGMREGDLITVIAVIDNRTGHPLEKPRVQIHGYLNDAKEMFETVEQVVGDILFDLAGSNGNNPCRMAQEVRRHIERVINRKWHRSPMIAPAIVPMSSKAAEEVVDEEVKESRGNI